MQGDFNFSILEETAHRPWPVPRHPWIMKQTWLDLLFAHWPVAAHPLAERMPSGLPLDLFDGSAWLGVVPFRMTNVSPRGVSPLPWFSAFPELNVRTYVRLDDKPGVYFFSLDATSTLAVLGARVVFGLPYFAAAMRVVTAGESVRYDSARWAGRRPAEFSATYRPVGPVAPPRRGSLEHFLTERYCLYTVDRAGRASRLEIHHPPWPLQRADAEISRNTMIPAAGLPLPGGAPLLHFSRRQDMVAWGMTKVR